MGQSPIYLRLQSLPIPATQNQCAVSLGTQAVSFKLVLFSREKGRLNITFCVSMAVSAGGGDYQFKSRWGMAKVFILIRTDVANK
jgi:hypothetical protein